MAIDVISNTILKDGPSELIKEAKTSFAKVYNGTADCLEIHALFSLNLSIY